MNTFQYLGNTTQSLAFRAHNTELQQVQDFGVFDIPAQYDEESNEIAPEKPYFSAIFGLFVDENGQFLIDTPDFNIACESYLGLIGWVWETIEDEIENNNQQNE